MNPVTPVEPSNEGPTHHNFDLGSRLAKKDGGFQRALAASDDCDTLSEVAVDVAYEGRMRCNVWGERGEYPWLISKRTDTRRDDDARSNDFLAVFHPQSKSVGHPVDLFDATLVDSRDCLVLEPSTIVDKVAEGERARVTNSANRLEVVQSQVSTWIRNV
jgi:hypothetical protein